MCTHTHTAIITWIINQLNREVVQRSKEKKSRHATSRIYMHQILYLFYIAQKPIELVGINTIHLEITSAHWHTTSPFSENLQQEVLFFGICFCFLSFPQTEFYFLFTLLNLNSFSIFPVRAIFLALENTEEHFQEGWCRCFKYLHFSSFNRKCIHA